MVFSILRNFKNSRESVDIVVGGNNQAYILFIPANSDTTGIKRMTFSCGILQVELVRSLGDLDFLGKS